MPSTVGSVSGTLPAILGGSTTLSTTAANLNTTSDYVNYIDIKLEGVHHLPTDWLSAGLLPGSTAGTQAVPAAGPAHTSSKEEEDANGSAAEVAFAFHPFRYEVTLSFPADTVASGGGGLQEMPAPDANLSDPTAMPIQSPSISEAHPAAGAAAPADNMAPASGSVSGATATAAAVAAPTAVVAAFTRGRLLRPSPAYVSYIAAAEAQPISGMDDAAPLRDVPAPIDADDVRNTVDVARRNSNQENASSINDGNSVESQREGTAARTAGGAAASAAAVAAPAILWVVTERTDGAGVNSSSLAGGSGTSPASSSAGGLLAAKRRMKSAGAAAAATSTASGGGRPSSNAANASAALLTNAAANNVSAAAAAAAVPGAPPPPLPGVGEAAPCVVRVPLTAAQEAHLNALLHAGAPLELHFRRTLRVGCPAEWEDLNASYYEAVIPVSLRDLSVPGSTHLSAEVPLQPACLYTTCHIKSLVKGCGADGQSDGGVSAEADPTSAAAAAANTAAVAGEHQDRNNNSGKKRAVARKARQTVPGLLIDEPDRSAPHPYVSAGTTAAVSLTLQRTLTRLASDRLRPAVSPAQLIPSRPTPTPTAATACDARAQLQRSLKEIVWQLLGDVREMAKGTSLPSAKENGGDGDSNNNSNRDSNNGLSASGGVGSAAWRAQFVAVLQGTGQLAAFKSRFAPFVETLVQERLRVHPAASAEEVARASNELYVQLVDMLHAALRSTALEGGGGAPADAMDAVAVTSTGEEEGKRVREEKDAELWWRALEAEVSNEVDLAGTLYQSRLAMHAGDAASWAALWVDCALYYQRAEALAKAEQCYREAIACDDTCVPALLDYGVWLLASGRLDEAAVFLHAVVDVVPGHLLGWACVGLLADLRELGVRVGSPDATVEQAKWRREHNLALRRAVECMEQQEEHKDEAISNSDHAAAVDLLPHAASSTMTAEERVYLQVAAYLVQLHHRDLANVCLARCRAGESAVELLYAQLFAQGGQYEEALKALDEVGKSQPDAAAATSAAAAGAASREAADTCLLLRAECVAALGRTAEAVVLYKQALSETCGTSAAAPTTVPAYLLALAALWRDNAKMRLTSTATSSARLSTARVVEAACVRRFSAYVRLCNALLGEGRYRDALGAVTLALQVWPGASVLWLGAGIAYFRAGDFAAAEECLQESNTLNPSNARAWAYLALLAVRLQHAGVEELVQQVVSLKLDDAALWLELGRALLNTALYPKLSVTCLRRAAALAKAQCAAKTPSSTAAPAAAPALYHLAHALMDVQEWAEAERLLREVATDGGSNEVLRGKAEEELAVLHAV